MNTPSVFNRRGGLSVTQAMSAGLGPGMHPRISIKGSRFTLIDAGGTKFPWQQLILRSHHRRQPARIENLL